MDCNCGILSVPGPHSGTRLNGDSEVDEMTNEFDYDALGGVGAVGEGVVDFGAVLKIGLDVGDELAHAEHQVSVPC